MRRLLVVTAALLAVGCSSPGGTSAPEADEPLSLRGFLSQPRPDEGTRILRTAIVNEGAAPVEVSSATVDWPGFERRVSDIDEPDLEPGGTVGVVLEYGEPRCGADVTARPRLAVIVDGAERAVPLTVRDPELLDRLRARECALRALDEAVSVRLRLERRVTERDGSPVVPGTLELRRRPGDTSDVRVVDLGGSVLLRFRAGRDLPAAVGETRLDLPVTVGSANRCDAHALSQSSQTFLIGAYVSVDGAEPVRVLTVPGAADKRRLQAVIRRDCGIGEE